MSWNGLDVVVFYESAIGYIFCQIAVGTWKPLSWIIMLKKKVFFTYKYSRCGRPIKASSLITSKEFDVNNLPRKSTQWKQLNWQTVNLCWFNLSEKWVGAEHGKISECMPFHSVIYSGNSCSFFFTLNYLIKCLLKGVFCAPLLTVMDITCPG